MVSPAQPQSNAFDGEGAKANLQPEKGVHLPSQKMDSLAYPLPGDAAPSLETSKNADKINSLQVLYKSLGLNETEINDTDLREEVVKISSSVMADASDQISSWIVEHKEKTREEVEAKKRLTKETAAAFRNAMHDSHQYLNFDPELGKLVYIKKNGALQQQAVHFEGYEVTIGDRSFPSVQQAIKAVVTKIFNE